MKKGPKPKHKEPGQFNVTGEREDIEKAKEKAKRLNTPLSEVIMTHLKKWIREDEQ